MPKKQSVKNVKENYIIQLQINTTQAREALSQYIMREQKERKAMLQRVLSNVASKEAALFNILNAAKTARVNPAIKRRKRRLRSDYKGGKPRPRVVRGVRAISRARLFAITHPTQYKELKLSGRLSSRLGNFRSKTMRSEGIGNVHNAEFSITKMRQRMARIVEIRKQQFKETEILMEKQLNAVEKLNSSLRADYRNRLGIVFSNITDAVVKNARERYKIAYPKDNKNLSAVVYSNTKFYKRISQRRGGRGGGILFCGIGNVYNLNRATPITKDSRTGKEYKLPVPYGVRYWWIFNEFSGAGPKKNFKKPVALYRAYVKMKYGLGGHEKMPFLVKDGELFPEDQTVADNIKTLLAQEFAKLVKVNYSIG